MKTAVAILDQINDDVRPRAYPEASYCAYPTCRRRLNIYNKTSYCHSCQRKLQDKALKTCEAAAIRREGEPDDAA